MCACALAVLLATLGLGVLTEADALPKQGNGPAASGEVDLGPVLDALDISEDGRPPKDGWAGGKDASRDEAAAKEPTGREAGRRRTRKEGAGAEAGRKRAPEPPLLPTPQGDCGPGSDPETGLQGRVSPADHASGRADDGFRCNTKLVGKYTVPNAIGTVAGFKVLRYVDGAGRECAYYDTTLMWPTNALDTEAGVNVLDMSDPSDPQLTARLVTPAMLTPHESLVLNKRRGLLAAVGGNLSAQVGVIDIYDVSNNCRQPELLSSTPTGILGHESGITPDGKTFYSASPASETLVAVDISNPRVPVPIWIGNYDSHGVALSDDGTRAYVSGTGSGLIVLDTTEIQERVLNPDVPEVSRLDWQSRSIPQNTNPITIDGHPYLVEMDEFGTLDEVGAGRIIDIEDERNPRVVSNLRLEVHQPENFPTIAGDNSATNPVQGYAGHYCNVPTRVDPQIAACSMILSGLRIFDISDPLNPVEIAYFNAPVQPRIIPPAGIVPDESNWAMSAPAFVPERNEIWYSDGLSGFYAIKVTNDVWNPKGADDGKPDDHGGGGGGSAGAGGDPGPSAHPGPELVGTLPFTGLDLRWLIGAGLLMVAVGLSVRATTRAPA